MPNWDNLEQRYSSSEVHELERTPEGRESLSTWAYELTEHLIEAYKQSPPNDRRLDFSGQGPPRATVALAAPYLIEIPDAIATIPDIRSIDLKRTSVTDLSHLGGLKSLEDVYLSGPLVTDVTPLAQLRSLTRLTLIDTNVLDLSPLSGISSLSELELRSPKLSDLSSLAQLSSLRTIDLSGSSVEDLSPLKDLKSLQRLWLRWTPVVDLSPLDGLPLLEEVYLLGSTEFSDLSPLAGCMSLRRLSIAGTKVDDVSPLAGLFALEELRMDSTQVADLSPLAELDALQVVDIRRTPALDHNPELRRVSEIQNARERADELIAHLNPGRPPRTLRRGGYESIQGADTNLVRAEVADLKTVLTENLEYARRCPTDGPRNALPNIFVDLKQFDDNSENNMTALFERMVDLLEQFDKLLQSEKPSDEILADLRRLWLNHTDTYKTNALGWVGSVAAGVAAGHVVGPALGMIAILTGVSVLTKGGRAEKMTDAIGRALVRAGRSISTGDTA